jgi:hypothetical protein
MDNRIAIWNTLHDGQITAISKEAEQTLRMFVNIPYLRRRLKPIGDSFVLILSGLAILEFENFDGTNTSLEEELKLATPEILSTESESMPITIATTTGYLKLDFQNIGFELDTGEKIEFESIEKACEEYWDEWEKRNPSVES